MTPPEDLSLIFYEPGMENLSLSVTGLIQQGRRRFMAVPENETSRFLARRFHGKEEVVFKTAQTINDCLSREARQAVIIITEENAEKVSRLLLDCLDLENGVVLSPVTEDHVSHRPFFVTTIPKSGTHLLIKMLGTMGLSQNYAPLPVAGKWNVIHEYAYHTPCKEFVTDNFLKTSTPMGKHPLFHSPVVFMYRNPLDILVSELSWSRKSSEIYSNFLNHFHNDEDRITALIDDPFLLGNIRERMSRYIGWLDFSNVIPVSYEELVGERGGGNEEEQIRTLWSLQLKLHIPGETRKISRCIYDEKSPTFSKGKIGQHKKFFKGKHYARFNALPQDFMKKMGYDFAGVFPKHINLFRKRPLCISKPPASSWWEQRLVRGSFYGFNIVYAGGQYVVIDQSLSEVEISSEVGRNRDGVYAGLGSYEEALAFAVLMAGERKLLQKEKSDLLP
jgi:hypothetical protein